MTIRNINISSSAAIATSKIADDGGFNSSHLSATLRQEYVYLDLGAAKLFDSTNTLGANLSTATAPLYNVISTGNSSVSFPTVQWSSAQVIGIMCPTFTLPASGYSSVFGINVQLVVSKSSNNDTGFTFEVAVITPTTYSTQASSKIDAVAATLYQLSIAGANAPSTGQAVAIRLTPGTHAADSIRLHSAMVSYRRT